MPSEFSTSSSEAARPSRIAIFGAGAIGSTLGGHLAEGGRDVVLVARGPHLAALRDSGLMLEGPTASRTIAVRISDDPASIGPTDLVVFTVKAHQLATAVDMAKPMLRDNTIVVTAVNGLPWWYFRNHGGRYDGLRLNSVDADGRIARAIGGHRNLGCIVYCAAEIVAPGRVRHGPRVRFILGAPDSHATSVLEATQAALAAPGIDVPIAGDMRREVWLKLWGNAVLNPLTALTGATVGQAAGAPELASTVRALFAEVAAVFGALGIADDGGMEARIEGARRLTGHRSSMLQDIEADRPPEIDEVVGVVVELARLLDVPVPRLETLLGCLRLRVVQKR